MTMLTVGCHLSSSGGYLAMGRQAEALGANTFQFFTRSPRGGAARAFDPVDAAALRAFLAEKSFGPVVAHAPYTLNPAAAEGRTREFAAMVMASDLAVLEHLPGCLYNFHPGSHMGQGTAAGVERIAALLNDCMSRDMAVTVLLETMAGKGSEIGGRFEELAAILDRCRVPEHVGVCLDTCHVSDGGYDVGEGLERTLDELARLVGADKLAAVHLNDSKNPPGSHKDRHELLGKGFLGLETFRRIVNCPRLKGLPMILETPNDLPGYAAEIALLRSMEETAG